MSNMYKRTKNDPRLTKGRKPMGQGIFSRVKGFFTRRRTDPWKVTLTKKSTPWARILAPILIVTIPLTVIVFVDNGLMRLPDLYKYHLLSSEILNERMIFADENDVAALISDYLIHKTNRFQMKEDLDYMPDELFTKQDGAMMQNLRNYLDVQVAVGLSTLLLTIALILFIIRKKERDLLLRSFYFSLPVFLLMKIIEIAAMLFGPIRKWVFGIPTLTTAADENLLPALFDDSFFRFLATIEVALSLVMLALVYYIVLNLSGRKTTFRR